MKCYHQMPAKTQQTEVQTMMQIIIVKRLRVDFDSDRKNAQHSHLPKNAHITQLISSLLNYFAHLICMQFMKINMQLMKIKLDYFFFKKLIKKKKGNIPIKTSESWKTKLLS